MKLTQLLEESLLGLPLRIEMKNVPLGDTGDFEGLTEITHGNGGTPVAEIWNSEEHQDRAFQYLCHAANVLPELINASKEMADNYCAVRCGHQDHTPICARMREALAKSQEVKMENDGAEARDL